MSAMTIAHATALQPEDDAVFQHALALACAAGARLFSVNAHDGSDDGKTTPDAARVLSGWGCAADQVQHEAMIHTCCEDPVDTLLDALRRVAPDLIVAGTHQRGTAERVFAGSQCEALLRNVTQPTLVFPIGASSLVTSSGRLHLTRMVIPIGDEVTARAAVARAVWLAEVTQTELLDIHLIFVGDEADAPDVAIPVHAGWSVHRTTSESGAIVDAVLAAAWEQSVVVMATRGTDSLRDTLFGTNTEQVLRRVRGPVFITPV